MKRHTIYITFNPVLNFTILGLAARSKVVAQVVQERQADLLDNSVTEWYKNF
jgi:hypothetical protein